MEGSLPPQLSLWQELFLTLCFSRAGLDGPPLKQFWGRSPFQEVIVPITPQPLPLAG